MRHRQPLDHDRVLRQIAGAGGNKSSSIACAEHDELAPLPMVDELRGLFERAGSPGELEFYPVASWLLVPTGGGRRPPPGDLPVRP
jgi:hypothetical protein